MDPLEFSPGAPHSFPSTHWSRIVDLKIADERMRRQLLDELLAVYWRPVYSYIHHAWNKSAQDACDLTQEFFLCMLRGQYFDQLDPARGRLRAYLMRSLKNFLIDMKRRQQARGEIPRPGKEDGRQEFVSLSVLAKTPEDRLPTDSEETPSEAFEREWVATVLDEAIGMLAKGLTAQGKEIQLECFLRYCLPGEVSSSEPDDGRRVTHQTVAEALGISAQDVKYHLEQSRNKLEGFLREVVRSYLPDPSEASDELKKLLGRRFA